MVRLRIKVKNRKKSLSEFIQNKRLLSNSRVLAVTAVSSKLGLIVGVNAHIIFGRENLIGEDFGVRKQRKKGNAGDISTWGMFL